MIAEGFYKIAEFYKQNELCGHCKKHPMSCRAYREKTDFSCRQFSWTKRIGVYLNWRDPVNKSVQCKVDGLTVFDTMERERIPTVIFDLMEFVVGEILTKKQQQLYEYITVDHLTPKEIAELVGRKSGTIREMRMTIIGRVRTACVDVLAMLYSIGKYDLKGKVLTVLLYKALDRYTVRAIRNRVQGSVGWISKTTTTYIGNHRSDVSDLFKAIKKNVPYQGDPQALEFVQLGVRRLVNRLPTRWKTGLSWLLFRLIRKDIPEKYGLSKKSRQVVRDLWQEYKMTKAFQTNQFVSKVDPPNWFLTRELGLKPDEKQGIFLMSNKIFKIIYS